MKLYLFIAALLTNLLVAEAEPVRVLLITGQNNHDWKEVDPHIIKSLEETGRFKVEVTESSEKFPPARLQEFDVLLSNWNLLKQGKNLYPEFGWSPEMKEAYINFVKDGGGHVSIHAGSSSYWGWKEYQELSIATWSKGTHHGPHHSFEVRMDKPEHPVTKGLSNFKKWDELWESIHVTDKNAKVITSNFSSKESGGEGIWEPSTLVSQYGKGRTAYTSLGHAGKAFDSKDFRVLFARLVEWAGTGEVTIPAPAK
ncbi:ThuA domain-containing protein [Rubritalea marina]|uniref:ThuA domain-containing protein n=1 Tax=Rubritalea marina TaxID=361055 RepID=UPI000371EF5B|nr:ThuA domain-containing protein [Rubritalea marina]